MGRFRREPRPRAPGYNPAFSPANGTRGTNWRRDRAIMLMHRIQGQAAQIMTHWHRHREARRERARSRRDEIKRRTSRDTVLGRRH